MSEFILWARMEPVGDGRCKVLVAVVPVEVTLRADDVAAASFMAASAAEARVRIGEELRREEERLRSEGHVVAEIRVDDRDPFEEDRRLT